MRQEDMYPPTFFNGENVKEKITLTIDKVVEEEIGEKKELKPVLHFTNDDRKLTLTPTKGKAVFAICGEDSDDWHGKKICLIPGGGSFQGKTGISVIKDDSIPL